MHVLVDQSVLQRWQEHLAKVDVGCVTNDKLSAVAAGAAAAATAGLALPLWPALGLMASSSTCCWEQAPLGACTQVSCVLVQSSLDTKCQRLLAKALLVQ